MDRNSVFPADLPIPASLGSYVLIYRVTDLYEVMYHGSGF